MNDGEKLVWTQIGSLRRWVPIKGFGYEFQKSFGILFRVNSRYFRCGTVLYRFGSQGGSLAQPELSKYIDQANEINFFTGTR